MKEKPVKRKQRVVARDRVSTLNPQDRVVGKPKALRDDPGFAVRKLSPDGGKLIGGVHKRDSRRLRLLVKTPLSGSFPDNEWMGQAREIVATNLQRLMTEHVELRTQSALARRSKVPQRTIGRIVNKEVTASLDVLEALAKPFDLQAWQLLVPGMDPKNPPVLRFASAAEEALYARIIAAATELAKKQP